MKDNEQILNRLSQLLSEGQTLFSGARKSEGGPAYVDSVGFEKWKVNSLSYLELIFGKVSIYYNNFLQQVDSFYQYRVGYGIGTLVAAIEDVKNGYLVKYKTLVSAEIFSDFLEIADYLLKNNYHHPAASLIGATLEDGLRKICDNNGITLKDKEDISSLNKKLADNEVYNRLSQKKIQVWKEVRDNADHGHFEKVEKEDVEDMLKGVTNFLSEYLK